MHPLAKFALLGLALGAGFLAPSILEKVQSHTKHSASSIDLNQYCQLSTATCVQNEAKLTLEHDKAQPLLPSKLMVEWPDQAESLMLTLQGLEMEMGSVKILLTPAEQGHYVGEVLLPVCTMDKMTWVGELTDGNLTVNTSLRMER
ncbi:hypothetical protein [Vibrio maerlii]|uniref:hypothetical protein n=1 Tax=Vibrio maerlii TaxID=2231648 RepID=UPI000E3BFB93|nr:hypothetical protein [Vibrio maerlii]